MTLLYGGFKDRVFEGVWISDTKIMELVVNMKRKGKRSYK
jgi:hypothetical protein